MKKTLLFLLLQIGFICLRAQDPAYPAVPASAQNVIAAEYFIDTDPGVGNASSLSITPGTNITITINSINTAGLSNGVHRIGIRTRSNEGRWSSTGLKDFVVNFDPAYPTAPVAAQNIIAAEYFIDMDPGIGSGQPISVGAAVNLADVSTVINTNGLSNGIHRVYIRTKSNEGRWSITNVKDFIVDADPSYPPPPVALQNITGAEYFIDTDPGAGNGQLVSITAATNIQDATASVSTAGLTNGIHRLYLRTRGNNGAWSITNIAEFNVDADPAYPTTPGAAQNMIAAEYFVDTDPGHGNGQPISISAGGNITDAVGAVNVAGLTNGIHRVYVRTKSNEGYWSLTNVQSFEVAEDYSYPPGPVAAQNIIAAEYFIDTDPGPGAGQPIAISAATDLNNISASVNTAGLSNGSHIVHVRTKNQEGKWSLSNHAAFFTDLLAVTPDTIDFGNLTVGIPVVKEIVVKNNSSSIQTITSINTDATVATDAVVPVAINAGMPDTIKVTFTPVNAGQYLDSVVFETSAGNYKTILKANAGVQVPSWSLEPADGHDYGNVALNSNNSYSFTIRNTGNIPITLSSVVINNTAFAPVFTPGTVVPVNGAVSLPVVFTPAAVQTYAAQLKIKSSTAGIDSVTTTLNGNGYAPGAPPVLGYPSGGVYAGSSGVSPLAGQAGIFTYKILYQSSTNKAPMAGYPQVSVDLNGDQDFNDVNEGIFAMVKEGSSNDYVTGVVYTYSFTHNANTSTAGYAFAAKDADGNAVNIAYKSGPIVTNDILDLRIFANDISFSMSNPAPGQSFTMTARIHNSTAVPAVNIPIKFYRDTILLGSDVLASVGPNSSNTITRTFNFAEEGFYPIKVWIDSSRTLGENNILNNYAIRPVIVGSPSLPGGITATTNATVQKCPQLRVLITGNAVYFGTGTNTAVAGAEVTINTGTQTFTSTTDASGNFSVPVTGVSCGSGNFAYAVTITDFTFTSNPVSASVPVPCPVAGECATQPPSQGGITASMSSAPCSKVAGTTPDANFVIKLRERNINNFWSGFDYINDRSTLYVFHDDVLVSTKEYGSGLAPGQEIRENIPVPLPSGSTTPIKVTVLYSYTYVEFSQIPSSTHYGHFINITERAELNVTPEPDLPDLSIRNFAQTSYTSFRLDAVNLKCGTAGKHVVKIFDGGATPIKVDTIASLAGMASFPIVFSDPNMTPGVHTIRVVTDADTEQAETDETNNEFTFTITVVAPDLTVGNIRAVPTLLTTGTSTRIVANIKNSGKATGSFNVIFRANGTQIGTKIPVAGVGERDSVTIISDVYTVTSAINSCGETIAVTADVDFDVSESAEGNNSKSVTLSADIAPFQLAGETGSASNPAVVRINRSGNFFPAIRNLGARDAADVKVRYLLNGVEIGTDSIANIQPGLNFAAHGAFSHMFDATGNFTIQVIADPANNICETNESNNTGTYYIRVVDSKPDLEVLSQYISPGSLNPQPDQNITIVGTVRNSGGKVSTASVMRFYVDNVQLGNDVPFNAIQPGKDTTVQATLTFSSGQPGTKIMKIQVDPGNTLDEEIEWNNEATRALIVGEAPDMARNGIQPIKFNPGGFTYGDSVIISYAIINNGTIDGTAWVRFTILDENGSLRAVDSIPFSLVAGGTTVVSRKMLFDITKGKVIAEIVNCTPIEYDFLNNKAELEFTTVAPLTRSLTVNGNLDMTQGMQDELPGWIGGKLLLGDFDLVINGSILQSDSAHFIVTNGTGRLKLVNNNAENIYPVAADVSHGNFVKIINTGTQDNFTVSVVPYVLQSGTSGDTVRTGNVNRTWFIDEQTPGGSNVTLQFVWNESDEQAGFERLQSRTAHYTSAWQLGDLGAAGTDSVGRFSKAQSGYTSFSPFTVTSVNTALPLTLLEFTVKEKEGNAQLQWKTTDEVNTSHFIIEHSINGRDFEKAGSVTAYNQPGVQYYEFRDVLNKEGAHYYRLQMVDLDGKFTYSGVQKITVVKAITISAYPNPASQNITISGLQAGGALQLLTMDGKLVRQWITPGNTLSTNLNGLAGGIYIIRYHNKGSVQQIKIMKE